MGVVTKLVFYVIPIVVLVLLAIYLFAGEGGAFEKVKSIASGAEEYVPNISIGANEIAAQEISLPTEHKSQISSLKEKIKLMMVSDKKNCFANYGGFPPLRGVIILMDYDSLQDTTYFMLKGGASGQQVLTEESFSVPHMHPCVIAGTNEITLNFWRKFMGEAGVTGDYYRPLRGVELKHQSGYNHLGVPEFSADIVNDEDNNFDGSQGWLFTPDNRHICFIPTTSAWTTSADEDGIDFRQFLQQRGDLLPLC